jgi:hypothetical protein
MISKKRDSSHAVVTTDAAGTGMVLPFGVTSFTTLVIGRDHRELLRDRPDRPGFAARVDEALRRAAH